MKPGVGRLGAWRQIFFAYAALLSAGVILLYLVVALSTPVKAAPGINQQINFQGRLLNQQGATVPDGFYNIQFKIYQDGDGQSVGNTTGSPSGTLLWTESHLNANSQGVQVKNGFLSVQLGYITAFGTSVDWNQDTLWLSLNIGDTNGSCTPFTSCSPDGEMVPMKRLSSSPYALNAGRLGGLASTDFLQLAQGLQTDASNGTPSIYINKTGTGNILELQSGGTSSFIVSNDGDINFGANADHSISVATAAADETGKSLTVTAGNAGTGAAVNGGDLVLQGGSSSGTGVTGSVIVRSNTNNSTDAFKVQNTSNTSILNVDTTNGSVQVSGLLDTTSATALNIGTTNATSINLNKNTAVSGSNTLTVGTGLTTLGGGLDVSAGAVDFTSSVAFKKGTDFSTTGTTDDANFGEASYIRLTGASAQTITGIANGRDGEVLTITNAASQSATLRNDNSSSAAANRIITGSGVDLVLAAGASVTLVYDSGSSLWRATGSAAGVTNIGTLDSQTKSANGAIVAGTTLYLQTADGTYPGLVSVGAQTIAGAKTFSALVTGNAGATFGGGALSFTGNTASSLTTSSGALTITSAAAATWSTGAGDLTLQAGSGTVSLGSSSTLTNTGALSLVAGTSLNLGSTGSNNVTIGTGGTTRATFDTSNTLYLGNGTSSATPSDFTISGTASSANGEDGGIIVLKGGNATTGSANGGNVNITGGTGVGTGVKGLVIIDTPTFSTATTQTCTGPTPCLIIQSNVDNYGAIIIDAVDPDLEVSLPDPTNTTAGRIVYVTADVASEDFVLIVNGGGTGNEVAMRANTTATMIWNGSDWTAAGASSSTTLQAAYNNTLTSAGGAEIVLNPPGGSADGLTIRNGTIPITGGILEVQSSIGTNLFSVNNLGTELAANGGSETDSTWATNWTTVGGSTVSRTTDTGEYVTGQAGVQVVTTAAANDGIRNNLSGNPVNTVGAEYQVSFTAKSSINGTPIDVLYSRNGGTNTVACTDYGGVQTLSDTVWTKITCTIVIDSATAATNPDLIIRKTNTTAPTIWIDNLSFMRNDSTTTPSNVQIGGGINGGPITLFTLDRSSAPPVANGNTTYLGSMYYDTTTGRIQCYEADGWGACGSAPDEIVTLTPEYTGAVLNGTGVGTLTADFCSNDTDLQVNVAFCASGLSRNYYRWTSPQATQQTYSIYVSYKLPSTFKEFANSDTITLTALTDSTSNGVVDYQVFRSSGSAVTSCGSQTDVTSSSADTWHKVPFSGDETACNFAAGDYIIFKINVRAQSNANVYVENLDFTYLNI